MVRLSKRVYAGAALGAAMLVTLLLLSVPADKRQSLATALATRLALRHKLHVTTDLDCEWMLDGKPRGRLKAHQMAQVSLKLVQHTIAAKTLDGKDGWARLVMDPRSEYPDVVNIELQKVREYRVTKEQNRAAEEARESEQKETKKRAAELERTGYWVDKSSGLMWTGYDNGFDISQSAAASNCTNLSLGGFRNWRLPSIEELEGLYDTSIFPKKIELARQLVYARGPIHFSGWAVWSGTPNTQGGPWGLSFTNGQRYTTSLNDVGSRMLCVRPSR